MIRGTVSTTQHPSPENMSHHFVKKSILLNANSCNHHSLQMPEVHAAAASYQDITCCTRLQKLPQASFRAGYNAPKSIDVPGG